MLLIKIMQQLAIVGQVNHVKRDGFCDERFESRFATQEASW